MTRNNTRRGFTLIELLVVVLIIGILAAAALPQYKKAVLKSRFAGVINNTAAIAKTLEVYYLANGTYPDNLQDTDISLGGCTTSGVTISCTDAMYYYYHAVNDAGKAETFMSVFLKNKLGLAYLHYTQAGNTWISYHAKQKYCWADTDNEAANQICQAMQGTPDGTENWHCEQSHSGRWNKYKLP